MAKATRVHSTPRRTAPKINAVATGVHEDQDELVHFAIYRVCEMVRGLRSKYRADLDAGPDRRKAVV